MARTNHPSTHSLPSPFQGGGSVGAIRLLVRCVTSGPQAPAKPQEATRLTKGVGSSLCGAVRKLTACLLLFLTGCGSSAYDLVPVSGIVTLDDKPVAGARVVFEPTRSGEAALNAGPGGERARSRTGCRPRLVGQDR